MADKISLKRNGNLIHDMTSLGKASLVVGLLMLLCAAAAVIGAAFNRATPRPTAARPLPQLAPPTPPLPLTPDYTQPVREIPATFAGNTHRPNQGEGATSGSVDFNTFSAGRDLIFVDDDRVWWESDHDAASNDDECDHTVHYAMREPILRLIELVVAEGGLLEVQDAYRASGVHNSKSLHKEGRALDITCDELGLGRLSKLAWGAGFDWVYYESKARGGAHVHVSVRRDRSDAVMPRLQFN